MNDLISRLAGLLMALIATVTVTAAGAGVSLSGTRLVFPGGEREATLVVSGGKSEVVFQSWLDIDDNAELDVPFTVVPALAKVDADQSQILRILYQGTPLPADRESLFWLNVQEIPKIPSAMAEGKTSGLSFTVRQRIKMFYRPRAIEASHPIATTATLRMRLAPSRQQMAIENSGPNHVTLINFAAPGNGKDTPTVLLGSVMVAPFTTQHVDLDRAAEAAGAVEFSSIDDLGHARKFRVLLRPDEVAQPKRLEDTPS